MAFLDGNVAADGFVMTIDILPIFFKRFYSTFDTDMRFGCAFSTFLYDLHVGDGFAEVECV